MARICGILIEHSGREYVVTSDHADLPDLLERDGNNWRTIKQKGPGGKAGATAEEILADLGQSAPQDHTQQSIKRLIIFCVTELIRKFFVAARW